MQTFRGRTMKEAVAQLKKVYGADAVIVATQRGQEDGRGFVEITARPATIKPQPQPPAEPIIEPRRRGVSAYTQHSAAQPQRADTARPEEDGPFAARARWLSQSPSLSPSLSPSQSPSLSPSLSPSQSPSQSPSPALSAPSFNAWGSDALSLAGDQLSGLRAARAVDEVTRLRDDLTTLRQDLDALRPAMVTEETLRRAMEAMTQQLSTQLQALMGAQRARPQVEALINLGLSRGDAEALAAQLGAGEDEARLDALLAEGLRCANPLSGEGPRALAFVGPTGVGKTTTIAKIAARARILLKMPVALVTVDTFRIAAVEQLARYAEILDCPLEIVKTPQALPQALARLRDYPLILIDTTGRNPRAADQVEALARFLPPGWGGAAILTLAANMREADLFESIKVFERLEISGLCVTKLDETSAPGVLYSLARRARRPLTWITDGQRVPEDIEEAHPASLAARIRRAAAQAPTLHHAS